MPKAQIHPFTAVKDCGWTALARIQNPDGELVLQATLSAVQCTIKQADGTTTLDAALTVSSVVFDTLQTGDARWTEDDIGFNFAYETPAAAFPDAGHYRIEFRFTPTAGQPYKLMYEGPALGGF